MALDGAWIALAGTIVGGVVGVAGKAFSDWLGVHKDREAREHQRKVDFEKWQREQLLVCVTASMRVVNLYIARAVSFNLFGDDVVPLQNDPDIRAASAEVQAQLTAIVFLYPDKSCEEFRLLYAKVDEAMWQAVPIVKQLWPVRQLILSLAAKFRYDAFPRELN